MFRRDKAISTKDLQTNDEIRAKEVRVVGAGGEQLGIMGLNAAKELAYSKGLDLVLMTAQAEPPVCKIMDYGKYRFDRDKKEKEARRNQQTSKVKEVQLSCRIDTHDFETRLNHAKRFLSDGDKVRVVVRFRGREMAHQDQGREVIERFRLSCAEFGSADKPATMEGRILSILITPLKK